MCTEHDADGVLRRVPAQGAVRATRRRFIAGGVGAIAGTMALTMLGGTAGAEEGSTDDAQDGATDAAASTGGGIAVPAYLNRPAWGADETLRINPDGSVEYPVVFFPVQKITVHHTASWTPWTQDDAMQLIQAVYAEHIAQEFGDIGYHLMIDPMGTVFEGRYSGGTSFPIYNNYPQHANWAPHAVNAAHTFNFNAGNIGISMLGNYDEHDISDEAWWALSTTIAMICANVGLDPLGESRYLNPINGVEAVLPNVLPHRTAAGTDCPGQTIVDRFDELRDTVAALVPTMGAGTWLA